MTRRSGSRLAFLLVLVVTVAVFLGKVFHPQAGLYTRALGGAMVWIGALAKLAFVGIAFAFAARNAREFEPENPSRLAWRLLAAGLLGFVLGQAALAVYQLVAGVAVPFPSAADLFLVLGYPLLIAALVQFLRAYAATGFPIGSRAGRWSLGVGVAAVAGLLGYSVLIPVVWTPGPLLEKILSVAYPAFDLVLLVLTVVLLRVSVRFRGGAVWKVWVFLLSGFFLLCVADILFAFLSGMGQVHLLDMAAALYILGFGCIAGGVLAQRELLLG